MKNTVEDVEKIHANELEGLAFCTEEFPKLFLDKCLPDMEELVERIWKAVVEGGLFDAQNNKWKTMAKAGSKPTEGHHGELVQALNKIIICEVGETGVSSAFKLSGSVSLKDGDSTRKPDIFTVHREAEKRTPPGSTSNFSWSQVRVIGEFKQNEIIVGDERCTNHDRASMVLTLAKYVREIFAQPGRRCVHGFSLCGLKMRTYLFDRAGVLASYSFSIDEQPKRFIGHILAYLCMDSDHLGFDPSIRVFTKSGSIITYDGTVPHINLQPFLEVTIADKPKKVFLDISKTIVSPSIATRGTICWPARFAWDETDCGEAWNHPCLWSYNVKLYWRHAERRSEGEFLSQARGIQGVISLVHHEDMANINADIRKHYKTDNLYQIKVKSVDPDARGSDVQASSNPVSLATSISGTAGPSTKRLRRTTKVAPTQHNRIQTLVITTPLGKPVSKARRPRDVLLAIKSAIIGHQGLLGRGLLHRDVSIGNIIHTTDGGYLIDLDFACSIDDTEPSGAPHRTGTPQFMAIAILIGSKEHTFRHDLESFFHVLMWFCTYYGFNPSALPHEALLKHRHPSKYSQIHKIAVTTSFELSATYKSLLIGDGLPAAFKEFAPGWAKLNGFCRMLRIWRDLIFPEVPTEEDPGLRAREYFKTVPEQEDGRLYRGMIEALDEVLDSM